MIVLGSEYTIMILAYAFCNTSTAVIRKEPSHKAEQVSELLFGEKVEILEINANDWAKIRVDWDGYEGWCKVGQLNIVSKKEYKKECRYVATGIHDNLIFENSSLWLPLGAELRGIKTGTLTVLDKQGKFKGKKLANAKMELNAAAIKDAAFRYLHAPYLWGGRSAAGIDCSGLTQMAFKLCGKRMLRDAHQQATEGVTVDFLQHAQCGDLAFFDNTDGKIIHVGILLDERTIIHATDSTGRVIIDKIDQGGIVSVYLRKRTHNLRLIQRYF